MSFGLAWVLMFLLSAVPVSFPIEFSLWIFVVGIRFLEAFEHKSTVDDIHGLYASKFVLVFMSASVF